MPNKQGSRSVFGSASVYSSQLVFPSRPTTFHVLGLDLRGEIVLRRKLCRRQLLLFTANRSSMLISMEARGEAHFLGRALCDQGHEVRLMPAKYVKPYVKTIKNDCLDAEAIPEAVQRSQHGD